MRKLMLSAALLLIAAAASAQKHATPETFDKPGPYPANMDFSLVAAAQDPGVVFLGGDKDLFKQADVVDYEIDFSKTKVGKKTFLESWKAENKEDAAQKLKELNNMCRTYFSASYNQMNKGLKVQKKENTGKTPYKMMIYVTKLNTGNGWGSPLLFSDVTDGKSAITGYVALKNVSTGKVHAVYAFNNVDSSGSVSKNLRIATPFSQLGLKLRNAATKK